MVFKPSDVMLVHFRNVDFNYATKGIVLGLYVRLEGREQLHNDLNFFLPPLPSFFSEEESYVFLLFSFFLI